MTLTELTESQSLLSEQKIRALMSEGLELEDIKEFLSINSEFVQNHGVNVSDIETYFNIQGAYNFKTKKDMIKKQPKPGDILEIWSSNGHIFHKNAHIETATYYDSGLTYCESPYIPFYLGVEKFSTSGGSWGRLEPEKCEHIGIREKLIKVWGHCGACGSGAFNIKVLANVYKIVIDRKYIPLYCGVYKDNNDYGYKYFIDTFDKTSPAFHSHKTCFRTLKGFKDYLKRRNLKIGGRMYWPNQHEIIGDFDFEQHMSRGEYEALKEDAAEFPMLDNGEYTGAYYKNGVVHFCNCNVKDRPKYPYIYNI